MKRWQRVRWADDYYVRLCCAAFYLTASEVTKEMRAYAKWACFGHMNREEAWQTLRLAVALSRNLPRV